MTFTNLQIGTIFLSFLTTCLLAILWQKRDKKIDLKKNQEHFSVLMSVFFWSAFLAFSLKLGLDFLKNINFPYLNSQFFPWFSIGMEEIVKISALIIGLEIAGKRFNEISDGIIYGVFAILGFLFFENIFYLLAYWDFSKGMRDFASFTGQRSIFSFAIHLSTLFFSFFYATAYLKIPKNKEKNGFSRPKPYNFYGQFKYDKKMFFILFGSFIFAVSIHILLDELMGFGGLYALFGLIFSGFSGFVIFKKFDKLDK